jgi:hypothetical protein
MKYYEDERADEFQMMIDHQYNEEEKKTMKRALSEFKNNQFQKTDDELVKSVSFTVKRNLAGFPFAPALTKE